MKWVIKHEIVTENASVRHAIWGDIKKLRFEDFAWYLATMIIPGHTRIRVFYLNNKLLFWETQIESRILENGRYVLWSVYYNIRYTDVDCWKKFIVVKLNSGTTEYVNNAEKISGMDIVIPVVKAPNIPPFKWIFEEVEKEESKHGEKT